MCVHDQGLWVEPSGRHALWGGLITSTEQQVWGLSLPQQATESWAIPARLWAPQTLNLVTMSKKLLWFILIVSPYCAVKVHSTPATH